MLLAAPVSVSAEEPVQLDAVEVSGAADDSVFTDSEETLAEKLATVPGGTNLVSLKDSTKLTTLSDALNYQPGVIVQEFFGGLDQPRLNVRGSGIQGNPVARGVLLRQDHLPLNDADGSFIIGVLNLRDTAMVAVHRGANSRVPGSFTLGGDLDFISRQGTASEKGRISTSFETGSFGQQMIHGAYDSGAGPLSWHGSLSDEQSGGYRHHSASWREQYHVNLAARLTDRLSNYSYLTFTDMRFEMPFVLPRAEAASHPQWVFGDGVSVNGMLPDNLPLPDFVDPDVMANTLMSMYARDPHRATQHLRFANNTTWWTQYSEHRLGWYWQKTGDAFVEPFSHIETDTDTKGLQWVMDGFPVEYFRYQVGLDYSRSDMPRTYSGNHPLQGSKLRPAYAELDLLAENRALSLAFDLVLVPSLTLTGQWQMGDSRRDATELRSGADYAGRWDYSLGKIGLIYQPVLDGPRWFMNLSESIELPTFWEIVGVDVNPLLTWLSNVHLQELEPQKAVSVEAGVDNKLDPALRWELTLFRSEIERELISTASQFGVIAQTGNYAGDTVHQGVELGISGQFDLPSAHSQRQLLYRTSWTYSDFHFVDGLYAGNQIAGVPENLLMAEVLWRQGAWRFGPNVRWLQDNNPVDHENTLGQGSHAVWGVRAESRFQNFLRAYLAIDNLLDETYNASFVVRARSNAFQPTYLPGNGRSLTVGLQLQF